MNRGREVKRQPCATAGLLCRITVRALLNDGSMPERSVIRYVKYTPLRVITIIARHSLL